MFRKNFGFPYPSQSMFPIINGITSYTLRVGDHMRAFCSFASSVSGLTLTLTCGPGLAQQGIVFFMVPSANKIDLVTPGFTIQSSIGIGSSQTFTNSGTCTMAVGVSGALILVSPSS